MPDKSFESLNMFERFERAPPVKDSTGNLMELGRLVPNALLFGKNTLKTKDGITSITTFSAFCARPKHYNSPEPLERLIFSEACLRLCRFRLNDGLLGRRPCRFVRQRFLHRLSWH